MNLLNIWTLLKKDFRVEWRQGYALAAVILFSITCGYLIYRTFGQDISKQVWNILIWIIVIFSGMNAVVKSFTQENKGTQMYYYTMLNPIELLISKLIYNFIFTLLVFGVLIFVFSVLMGNPIVDDWLFYKAVVLGILGMSTIFTFVSCVSSASGGNNTMMSILALPLVIPIVLILIRVTAIAMNLMADSEIGKDLLFLGGIDVMILGVCLIIFPSMWRT